MLLWNWVSTDQSSTRSILPLSWLRSDCKPLSQYRSRNLWRDVSYMTPIIWIWEHKNPDRGAKSLVNMSAWAAACRCFSCWHSCEGICATVKWQVFLQSLRSLGSFGKVQIPAYLATCWGLACKSTTKVTITAIILESSFEDEIRKIILQKIWKSAILQFTIPMQSAQEVLEWWNTSFTPQVYNMTLMYKWSQLENTGKP